MAENNEKLKQAGKVPMPNPQIGLGIDASRKAADLSMKMARQLAFLSELLEAGTCSPSSVDTHMRLTRSQYEDLSAMLGGKDVMDAEHAETTRMLRDANARLARMEQAAGEKTSFEAVMAGFKALCDAFDSWYSLSGFEYAKTEYSKYGLRAEVSHELDLYESDEDRAMSHFGDKALKSAIMSCHKGVDFGKLDLRVDGTRYELLDTEKNRKYLKKFVAASFPGAHVSDFRSMRDGGDYLLRFTVSMGWDDVDGWKQRMLAMAKKKSRHGIKTGKIYLDRIDAHAKLASRTWLGYAPQDMIDRTKADLERLDGLASRYEAILAMPRKSGRDAALADFLLQNGLDRETDLEGSLYG